MQRKAHQHRAAVGSRRRVAIIAVCTAIASPLLIIYEVLILILLVGVAAAGVRTGKHRWSDPAGVLLGACPYGLAFAVVMVVGS